MDARPLARVELSLFHPVAELLVVARDLDRGLRLHELPCKRYPLPLPVLIKPLQELTIRMRAIVLVGLEEKLLKEKCTPTFLNLHGCHLAN